jgi:hypothetical protein
VEELSTHWLNLGKSRTYKAMSECHSTRIRPSVAREGARDNLAPALPGESQRKTAAAKAAATTHAPSCGDRLRGHEFERQPLPLAEPEATLCSAPSRTTDSRFFLSGALDRRPLLRMTG